VPHLVICWFLLLLFSFLPGAIQAIQEQTFDCFFHIGCFLLGMLVIGMPHEASFMQVGWYRLIVIFIFPYHKFIVVLFFAVSHRWSSQSHCYFPFVTCFYIFPSCFPVKDHHGHWSEDAAAGSSLSWIPLLVGYSDKMTNIIRNDVIGDSQFLLFQKIELSFQTNITIHRHIFTIIIISTDLASFPLLFLL